MDIERELNIISINFLKLKEQSESIQNAANVCINALKQGKKILFCGNGGSAADAQHLAAELVVKYKTVRNALPAIALTTDTSIITAIGNDLSSEYIFSRQVEALGISGDVLVAITTSGNSVNIIKALHFAKSKGLNTVVLTGANGKNVSEYADVIINAPSNITNNIQEMHIAIGHMMCEIIEENVQNQDYKEEK